MHCVYIVCLLEMHGRQDWQGGNKKYIAGSLNETSESGPALPIGLLHFSTFWIAHTFAVLGI